MLSSFALRLKALSPFQLALLVLVAFALGGSSTAVAANLITGADVKDRSLTGRDIARDTVTADNVRNESLNSHDLQDGHVLSRDLKDGTIEPADLSPAVREQLGKGGAKGEKGDTGSQGPRGDAAGAPGGFLVKDADNTTAGTLLNAASRSSLSGSFYYKGHVYDVDFRSGQLQLGQMGFYYTTPDCSGTEYAYAPGNYSVFVKYTDPTVYGYNGKAETIAAKSRLSGFTCVTENNSVVAAPAERLPTADLPPTLQGPLHIVSAN